MRGSRGIARMPVEFRGARDVVIGGEIAQKEENPPGRHPGGSSAGFGGSFFLVGNGRTIGTPFRRRPASGR